MKELRGNLHDIPCDVVCITTNGFVSKNGKAVMGRGCAKEIKEREPGIDVILGTKIRELGPGVLPLKTLADGKTILSFPVKPASVIYDGNNIVNHAKNKFEVGDEVPGYFAKAELEIIEESARALRRMADSMPEWNNIILPRPGCGAGELTWSDVKPILAKYFDHRFSVVTFPFHENAIYYAGIGARDTPEEALSAMNKLSAWLGSLGLILRSGGAEGADTAFDTGTLESEILLPWPRFNGHSSQYDKPSEEAKQIASNVHWNWENCKPAVQNLHGRNAQILLGPNLDKPVKFVICWTEDGKDKGGTGVALRIARQYKIPIFNLGLGISECIREIASYVLNHVLETRVVNLYKEPYDEYIGRPRKGETSIWHNPFIVGVHGERGECVKLYETYIRDKLESGEIPLKELKKLKGKRLGCFCKPQDCHGDVLVKLIKEYFP